MALDPEELKKRRQQRLEQRKLQQARRKSLLIKLGIALGVLVLVGILILVLVSMGNDTPPAETVNTPPATGTEVPPETAVSEDTAVVHLAFAGDLNVTEQVANAEDYTRLLMDVTPALADADLTVLNFEGSFFGGSDDPDHAAPQALADALADAGVDMLQIANSYSIFKGMEGLSATVNTIRAAGMEPLGAYASQKEAKAAKGYTLREVNGVKLAFVAFTKGMDGMALPPGNESCVNLLYTDYATDYQKVDKEGITRVIEAAKRERPDVIIALLHWGSEYNNTISKTQTEILELLQENGVRAVIGTHSHYVQGMTLDPETNNFVAYSLGDFIPATDRAGSEYSVVLELEITKDLKARKTRITSFDYTPIFTVAQENRPLQVVRIQPAIDAYSAGYIDRVPETTFEAMKYALGRIKARIHGESAEPEETTAPAETTE